MENKNRMEEINKNKKNEKINLYVCEILKEFDFNRVGEVIKLFIYDYERILKQHPNCFKLLRVEDLKI